MGLNPNTSRKPGPNGKHAFFGIMAMETNKRFSSNGFDPTTGESSYQKR
jgi:hypothetical protein